MKAKNSAIIVERKRRLVVRIDLADGTRIYADRRQNNGRIVYDTPERLPRDMRDRVVPALFKDIDKRLFG